MTWLGRFFLWRARRCHAAHKVWLRNNHVVYERPKQDDRNWSEALMKSLRK